MSVLALILAVFTGFVLVRLAWPNGLRWCRHDLFRLALGAGAGLAISSVICFLVVAFVGGDRAVLMAGDITIAVALVVIYFARRRESICPFCAVAAESHAPALLRVGAAASLAAASGAFAVFMLANPTGEWDAWAIWNLHARFLTFGGAAWTNLFSPELSWSHPDYPLLLPAAVANAWIWAGGDPATAPRLIAALFSLGVLGVVGGGLYIVRGASAAMLGMIALLGAAAFARFGASQYADVPLAFFFAATLAVLAVADRVGGDRAALLLAGAMAGSAAWTKNEGLPFLAAMVLARVFALWRSGRMRSAPRQIAMLAAGAAPILVVLAIFKLAYAPPGFLFAEGGALGVRLGESGRFMTVVYEFGQQLFVFGGWIVPPLVALGAYAVLMGRSSESRTSPAALTALTSALLMGGAYFAVYLITPNDLNWQLGTSLARVLMQIWPSVIVTLFLFTRRPEEYLVVEERKKHRVRAQAVGRRAARR